ncbi:MAG TPA: reverse transcriptase family protein [Candidatus Enterocloster faecavium]|mgnify:FL=1|uniref:RNA-directed DNA polymerase n=1 Tax=Candidatus Enterocloster faecavium TaxID=2838560 RepID=A0A9D2RLX8_9FIRM|nr:reverse transcriptase family protein [Candidatus Enterocloster faecavium]
MGDGEIWKYCGKEQAVEMILSLQLLPSSGWQRERILACLYALSNHPEEHYHPVWIPKRRGGYRRLDVPDPLLKQVQRNILHHVLEGFSVSPAAAAYRKNRCAADGAAVHIGKPLVLKLDIHDFFGSITFPMVLGYGFPAAYFPEEVRVLLASLCCCRQRLPQGAPTSPALSNLVMKHFDEAMAAWCGPQNIAYTRYCDDMTFSGDLNPGAVIGRVRGFLETMGMELNHSKTAVCSQFSRQTVTGITVNQVCQLPREDRRKLRQEVYLCLRYGTGESRPADSVRRLEQILGKVSYLLQVRPDDRWFLEQREALKEMLKKERGQVYES